MPNPTSLRSEVTVVGAGLVGSLLALGLAQRGHRVTVLERRPDMRCNQVGAGRSINLAVSTRGLRALNAVGFASKVLARAVPMRGRMMHARDGSLTFQPYGKDNSEAIHSISRSELNQILMTAAEDTGIVQFAFRRKVIDFDARGRRLLIYNETAATDETHTPGVLIAADGAASSLRTTILRANGGRCDTSTLLDGYKELTLPAGPDGRCALPEKHALHIWPRGSFMLIALPNYDGSFTCTLFLARHGSPSLAELTDGAAVERFFQQHFADVAHLFPNLAEQFLTHPTGHMVTIKCSPWHVPGAQTMLLGDAAHAIVPFFGQGMNCGFEDCDVLWQGLDAWGADWDRVFAHFSAYRKVHADAIADMAVENFTEMRDKVSQPRFLLEKAVETRLQQAFPEEFVSRYSMVTFSDMPYRAAFDAGRLADAIVHELCAQVDDPHAIDMRRAGDLIRTRLSPFLAQYRQGSPPWT